MIMLYKKFAKSILILSLCVASLGLNSAEAERQATIELLDAIQFEKTLTQSIDFSIEMIKKMTPEGDKEQEIVGNFLKKAFDIEMAREEMVQIYSEIFTLEEIQEMTAFYKTKTGQKTLEKMPEIMQRSMELTNERLTQNMDNLFKMLDEELKNNEL